MQRHVIWFVAAIAGCTGPTVTDSNPLPSFDARVEVDPLEITFIDVFPGSQVREQIEVHNIGEDTVLVSDIEATGDDAFALDADLGIVVLPPGETVAFDVIYTPTDLAHEGWVSLHTDDPLNQDVLIPLIGEIEPGQLEADPLELDFGNVLPGDSLTLDLTLTNIGGMPLSLDDIDVNPGIYASEYDDFDFELGAVLAPGESVTSSATFQPTVLVDAPYQGVYTFSSSTGEPIEVPYYATARNTPIAVCEASPPIIHAWDDTTDFVGSASHNPAGGEITAYEWTLISQPTGSAVSLPTPLDVATIQDFRPDLAGEYIAQLVVWNEMGVPSEPCEAVLTAGVGDDMWIELYWQHDDDDMDLHLVRPGGSLNDNRDDCYWDNCQYSPLEWGDPNNDEDNPSLDFDDIFGTGPESINIEHPAAGTYAVWVHDFADSHYPGANLVTVNIYTYGVLVWTGTRRVTGENSETHFADVTFPGGVVTPAP